MLRVVRAKATANLIGLTLVLCLAVRPTMNARDSSFPENADVDPLAVSFFKSADVLAGSLRDKPLDSRSEDDYRRVLDAYDRVVRLGTDPLLAVESLARAGELMREMADISGDALLYQRSIETFRRLAVEHPDSKLVGYALASIAQVYEENLQDLDGAAGAYTAIIRRYPSSVIAREAKAVIARFDSQLQHRPRESDVMVPDHSRSSDLGDEFFRPQLNNIRTFGGADFGRVVLDLSGTPAYMDQRAEPARIRVRLNGACVSSVLYGRRFVLADSALVKRITVAEEIDRAANAPAYGRAGAAGDSVVVTLEIEPSAGYSVFRIDEPNRLIIDLHRTDSRAEGAMFADSRSEAGPRPAAGSHTGLMSGTRGEAIMSLPEITDPIIPFSSANTVNSSDQPASPSVNPLATLSPETSSSAIRCIVIDPGHGGHDTGTIGSGGLREKDLVLDVARRLKAYIKRSYPEVEVILTRDSDRFVALEERTAIANVRKADLFISVHANASPSRIASGVETFFVSPNRVPKTADLKINSNVGETAEASPAAAAESPVAEPKAADARGQNSAPAEQIVTTVSVGNRISASRELARYIQAGLVRGIGSASPRTAANRGVKHAPFAVLVGAAMPSVLAEVSFMSNPRDENLLRTSQFRERIAASLFAGLSAYLKKSRSR